MSFPEKPNIVILFSSVTFSPSNDFQFPNSGMPDVTVGKVIKLFTPVAKKRYATIGRINNIKRTRFFFITNVN